MRQPNLWAVLLAGGSGTRFWPASRRSRPKQFLPIAGGRSLLAQTAGRLRGLVPWERMLVVTGREHVELVRRHLPRLAEDRILAEPTGRNTAPAVAWAALEIERRDPGSVHCVLPSDHVISPAADFRAILLAAAEEAGESGGLLTFGIRPTFAATGYGWIEAGRRISERRGFPVSEVARFVEKPDRARAEAFLAGGRHLWNSGMFVWRNDAILSALREHAPELHGTLANAVAAKAAETVYATLPSVSVDVAVLEKAAAVRVIPIEFRWSDVGSWSAISDVLRADEDGNRAGGGVRLLADEAADCIAWGNRGDLTVLFGVKDLVVVRAGKATLVCPRERAQELRRIVARLEKDDPSFL